MARQQPQRIAHWFGFVSVLGLLAACAGGDSLSVATPESVQVTGSASTVPVGGSLTLSATVRAKGATLPGSSVTWSSSAPSIASVTNGGMVTGIARGQATISASAGAVSGSTTITVLGVRSVSLSPATLSLAIGQTATLVATTDADPGVTPALQWSSSSPAVVTVSATGGLTAVSTGTATITVSTSGVSASASITVRDTPAAAVTIAPSAATVPVGRTQQFTATVRDSAGQVLTGRSVAWSSASPTLATVSAAGLVTGVAVGNTTITASVDGRNATAQVTIAAPVATVAISPAGGLVAVGGSLQLIAVARDVGGAVLTGRPVVWSSAAPTIATVSPTGLLTGMAPGSVIITAEVEGIRGNATFASVAVSVATVTIASLAGAVTAGTTQQLTATVRDSAGAVLTGRTLTWSSSASTVATVSSEGMLTAIRPGSTIISATTGGRTGQVTVSVDLPILATPLAGFNRGYCALSTDGDPHCWAQLFGEVPTRVAASESFSSIATGDWHSCGLRSTGELLCWGANELGQVGDGTRVSRGTPVRIGDTLRFRTVSIGFSFSCASSLELRAYCWGDAEGTSRLGTGDQASRQSPAEISGDLPISFIGAGRFHACGLLPDGRVYCWGTNASGQIGDGTNVDRSIPTLVGGSVRFRSITTGWFHNCGVSTIGEVWCWGRNEKGQSGNATSSAISVPVRISGISNATSIAAGLDHSCAVVLGGQLFCWGSNQQGQIGDSSRFGQFNLAPIAIPIAGGASRVIAGDASTCALTLQGKIFCWGDNQWGQGGSGLDVHLNPQLVSGNLEASSLVAMRRQACALTSLGAAYCWGDTSRVFGSGTASLANFRPTATMTSSVWTTLAGGAYHMCGVSTAATVSCWGNGAAGQLGNGSTATSTAPVQVPGLAGIQRVAAGDYHSCALASTRRVLCWGENGYGQLGDGTTTNRATPVSVQSPVDLTAIVAGITHSCGLATDGTAYCWGRNQFGQLGIGTTTNSTVPTRVSGSTRFTALHAGWDFTCGLATTGLIYCWGNGADGRTGLGTQDSRSVPTAVAGDRVFTQLAGALYLACGITAAGESYCWGDNSVGQLGTGDRTDRLTPTLIGASQRIRVLGGSEVTTCGVDPSNRLYCWGDNSVGQVGVPMIRSPRPVSGNITFKVP